MYAAPVRPLRLQLLYGTARILGRLLAEGGDPYVAHSASPAARCRLPSAVTGRTGASAAAQQGGHRVEVDLLPHERHLLCGFLSMLPDGQRDLWQIALPSLRCSVQLQLFPFIQTERSLGYS